MCSNFGAGASSSLSGTSGTFITSGVGNGGIFTFGKGGMLFGKGGMPTGVF